MIQYVKRSVFWSTIAAFVFAPCVVGVLEVALGHTHLGSVITGSVIGTLFFAITGAAGVIFDGSVSLKKALMGSYALKVVVLLLGGLFASSSAVNRLAFAEGVLAAAATYLVCQTYFLTRKHLSIDLTGPSR